MTTVISVRGRKRAELEADPNFVYVGRRCGAWRRSQWGNPFSRGMTREAAVWYAEHWEKVGETDRRIQIPEGVLKLDALTAVDLYRQWILACPALRERIPELRGKTLGCWCGNWQPGEPEIGCHAIVLAQLADAAEGGAV